MRSLLLLFPLFPLPAVAAMQSPIDANQAEAMFRLLRACHAGNTTSRPIEAIMLLPGTQLIVAQQNISRRITASQYRTILERMGNSH